MEHSTCCSSFLLHPVYPNLPVERSVAVAVLVNKRLGGLIETYFISGMSLF